MVELFKRCLNCKDYTHTSESGDYCIQVDNGTIYLLFECSNGVEDWKNNFSFFKKPYKDMEESWRCHGGFLKVWKSMQDDIESKVARLLIDHPEIQHITCIGYSHGAALAVFCTEDMEYWYGKRCEVRGYGFGTPRVIWGKIPESVKFRLRRFVSIRNIPDIVTHLPPMLFGFRNAGTLVKVGKKGKYSLIDAHRPNSYIEELENHFKSNGGENGGS